MPQLDLVVRGGQLSTEPRSAIVDVGILDGRIVQLGGDMQAVDELDAHGKLLLPGGVDAHVHLSSAARSSADAGPAWVDDFQSGSGAALAGGVTSIGNMTFPANPDEAIFDTLQRDVDTLQQQAIADVFLHPVVINPSDSLLADIPRLLDRGYSSLKFFMPFPGFDMNVGAYLEVVRRAGESGLLTMIHCEDHALTSAATARLLAAGQTSLRAYAESRPVLAEAVATQRAVALAEATGSPVYLVHLSSQRALESCADAQARGVPVFVETRPMYLHLTGERLNDPDGPKYIGQPPLREQSDVDALWAGLAQGAIHTVCTDHAPWSLEAKLDPAHDLANLRPGVENLQTMLPMLYSEGVRRGRISLDRFIDVTSRNAAKLFGLYPRKGALEVGSDADIVVFDSEAERVVTAGMLKSRAGYSVYDGWRVTGWPAQTLRRGEVVLDGDTLLGHPGSGQLLECGPTRQV
ncbi:MAG: amidohydrolase family protein [Chloroflexota bacterium]|nr:amidohydrolase family protein [Chloroflexota bacterium]